MTFHKPLILFAAFTISACHASDAVSPAEDEIIGSWESSGSGIAPEIAWSMKPRRVEVNFEPNFTYAVIITDSAYAITVLSGTWRATGHANAVRGITLHQRSPSVATARGIFQVDGSVLRFEVVPDSQTDDGVMPPTVSGGFGSTTHEGESLGSAWLQYFTRHDDTNTLPCTDELNVNNGKRPCDPLWTPTESKRGVGQ